MKSEAFQSTASGERANFGSQLAWAPDSESGHIGCLPWARCLKSQVLKPYFPHLQGEDNNHIDVVWSFGALSEIIYKCLTR